MKLTSAERIVAAATELATATGHRATGEEHLLWALNRTDDLGPVLARHGLAEAAVADVVRDQWESADVLTGIDTAALAVFGVDIDAIRARLTQSLGGDQLRRVRRRPDPLRHALRNRRRRHQPGLTRHGRAVLDIAVRKAAAQCREVSAADIALAVLDRRIGFAADVVDRIGVDRAELSRALAATMPSRLETDHKGRFDTMRVGGLAAVVGGVLTAAASATHFHGASRPLVPIAVACLALGVVGLRAAVGNNEPRLRRWGTALALIGVLLGVIGMAGSAAGIVGTQIAHVINTGEHAGLLFIGAGLTAYGVATTRQGTLGPILSALPALVGMFGLVGVLALDPALLVTLERSIVPVLFGLAWAALGVALLAAHSRPMAARRWQL